jgi:wyosine [tRNA(Phe)-imidazoG37] synthetase (radical SAM superfamily)
MNKYIFGPVPSRRLGYSLGIDVVPFKTCSYDCIYCQLGRTSNKTVKRENFVPVNKIIKELKTKLNENGLIDYITVSGSGEPLLYSDLGRLISEIKKITELPLAVLTNGSLLWDTDIQKSLLNADLVIPSLDAGNENIFNHINRPCRNLDFDKIVNGMINFREIYKNKLWLEVFLLNGVNSIRSEILSIKSLTDKIKPDKIQLNTVARPPAESFAEPVPENDLIKIAGYFEQNTEIIAGFNRKQENMNMKNIKEEIINMLKRRPCSLEDISGAIHIHKNEAIKYLEELMKKNKVTVYTHNHIHFYGVK